MRAVVDGDLNTAGRSIYFTMTWKKKHWLWCNLWLYVCRYSTLVPYHWIPRLMKGGNVQASTRTYIWSENLAFQSTLRNFLSRHLCTWADFPINMPQSNLLKSNCSYFNWVCGMMNLTLFFVLDHILHYISRNRRKKWNTSNKICDFVSNLFSNDICKMQW